MIAAVVAALIVTQVAIFVTTVYLHRALTHRALTVHPERRAAVPGRDLDDHRHAAARVGRGAPQAPRRDRHRRRSAQPEAGRVSGGCNSATSGLYKRVAADAANTSKYARDIPPDRLDRLAFDYSLLGLGLGTTILIVTMWALGFGLLTGLLAAGLHAVFYVMLSGAINAIGHTAGKQPYENSATNLQSLAFITAGEGLHNNHHAAPTSARFALHKGEIDPGAWLVRVLVKLHLARRSAHDERAPHSRRACVS